MRKLLYLVILFCAAAIPASAGTITVNWTYTQGADTATGFNVYRGTDGFTYTKLTGSPLSIGTLTYADSTASNGIYYYYVVTAVDSGAVESAQSNQIVGQFNSPAPVAPSKFTVIGLF